MNNKNKIQQPNKIPVLCYVDGNWAYFTTRKLSEQWGDDWDDAPYEHNAGVPYEYSKIDKSKRATPWEIIKVAYDGEFQTPCSNVQNSPWSVREINSGAVAWLRNISWDEEEGEITVITVIPAGTPLDKFCELIKQGGGKVYFAKDDKQNTNLY